MADIFVRLPSLSSDIPSMEIGARVRGIDNPVSGTAAVVDTGASAASVPVASILVRYSGDSEAIDSFGDGTGDRYSYIYTGQPKSGEGDFIGMGQSSTRTTPSTEYIPFTLHHRRAPSWLGKPSIS